MRSLAAILLCTLAMLPLPAHAADPSDVFSTILGEIGRQIERDRQKKVLKHLRPLWEACDKGDVAACDRAALFPQLNDEGRATLARMRAKALAWKAYERDFYACQKSDRAACQAALAYPHLRDADRSNLLTWKRAADQRHEALAIFQQNQRQCFAGSLTGCDAAIADRHLDESAIPALERQRASLQRAEDERRAREHQRQAALAAFRSNARGCYSGSITACDAAIADRHLDETAIPALERQRTALQRAEDDRRAREHQRQAALAEFRRHQRGCYSGSIAACDAAIADRHLDESAIPALERQRTALQRAEDERRAREQQRQAAIRAYVRLRDDCARGQRPACQAALAHAHVEPSDRALLESRNRELAPLTEKIANVFTLSDLSRTDPGQSGSSFGLVLLGVIALLGVGAGTLVVRRKRGAAASVRQEPPALAVSSEEPSQDAATPTVPLTGHMPTDVRRAILAANA
ncbi:MAG: hypothetical protein AB7O44_31200 [Hyphomicrobiaceae bacterium]